MTLKRFVKNVGQKLHVHLFTNAVKQNKTSHCVYEKFSVNNALGL